jgi:hypothetical protein
LWSQRIPYDLLSFFNSMNIHTKVALQALLNCLNWLND